MIYIDRNLISPPPIFESPEMYKAKRDIQNFYSQDASIRRQQKYTNPRDIKLRREFVPALREEFNGKCAYCESRINLAIAHSEYDHFRPKQSARGFEGEPSDEHYWWLVYNWNNIYYSCAKCNMYKSNWFPVEGIRAAIYTEHQDLLRYEKNLLVDPCWNEPAEHFEYGLDGQMKGLTPSGLATIDVIKLNREDLVKERLNALKEVEETFKIFESIVSKAPVDVIGLNVFFEDWRDIFSNRSIKPYLGIQRYFLSIWLDKYELTQYLINRDFVMPADDDLAQMLKREKTEPTYIDFEKTAKVSESVQDMQRKVDNAKHIFIEKMELKNFKCFSNLTVEFNNQDSGSQHSGDLEGQLSEPWILFLGENGVGKSSILKAFSIGLAGWKYINTLGLKGSDLLKSGEDSGFIKLHMVGEIAPATVIFTETEITSNIQLPLINFVAYNAIRLKHTPPMIIPEDIKYVGAKAKNLFDYTASIIDCDKWLSNQNQESFDRVARALKDLMSLDNKEHIVLIDGRAGLKREDRSLYIDELSDGYQAIFHMAIDIMATIQQDGLPFNLAEGMIIIDEIGAHLHPRWRMEVVEKLRSAFPKMRFVVSTHEPLCLRGIRKGEAVVLQKDRDRNVHVIVDLPNPAELRVDQILTSDFFGLNSTRDRATEQRFIDYYDLLAKNQDELTDDEVKEIFELKSQLPQTRYLGDDVRESIVYEVVDRLLAEKKAKNTFENVEEITQEAFLRLQKIWDVKSSL